MLTVAELQQQQQQQATVAAEAAEEEVQIQKAVAAAAKNGDTNQDIGIPQAEKPKPKEQKKEGVDFAGAAAETAESAGEFYKEDPKDYIERQLYKPPDEVLDRAHCSCKLIASCGAGVVG